MENYKTEEELRLIEVQTAFLMDMQVSMAVFKEKCPYYIDTPENAAILAGYFPKEIHRAPTVLELMIAFAKALVDGKINGCSVN